MRSFPDVLNAAEYDETDLVNYPYGRPKDNTTETSADGTPIMEKTWGDFYNGFIELLRRAGITPSGNPEKKGVSDIADAVDFLSPVMILKCGYDGSTGLAVLNGKYKAGWTAEYVAADWNAGLLMALNKLTVKKDGNVYVGDLFVNVAVESWPAFVDSAVVAGADHGSVHSAGYFQNNTNNIFIAIPGSATADEEIVSRRDVIITVYKV